MGKRKWLAAASAEERASLLLARAEKGAQSAGWSAAAPGIDAPL